MLYPKIKPLLIGELKLGFGQQTSISHISMSNKKPETEKQKMIQEKCQAILHELLKDEENKYCVDCDAKGPRWASWNLGVFLCIRCAGIHRNLGVHVSKVKSVNLDTWTPEQVAAIQQMGNSRARAVYEANIPENFRRPQTDSGLEMLIRAKYEQKKYIAQEWVPQPLPKKVNWALEMDEKAKKRREKKRAAVEIPVIPAHSATPPSNQPASNSASGKMSQDSNVDLLGLDSTQPDISTDRTVDISTTDDLLGLASPPRDPPTDKENGPSGDLENFLTTPASIESKPSPLSKDSILALYGNTVTSPQASFSFSAPGGQPGYQQSSVMASSAGMQLIGFQNPIGYPPLAGGIPSSGHNPQLAYNNPFSYMVNTSHAPSPATLQHPNSREQQLAHQMGTLSMASTMPSQMTTQNTSPPFHQPNNFGQTLSYNLWQ
ncbi:unnamed protein product [Darwinula stevensoni]|uniref:Arf-GAP domain-containing protein n=1 Tax=Darwinula stevensoni TaxID=69355 RepID=A0A7R8X192_9CRUS|nr:unnamed protein product [Darwinula stevensoni]CAG0882531.1 unnamed protein product [Darwinula stevensoni]